MARIEDFETGIQFTTAEYVVLESARSVTLRVWRGDDSTNVFTVQFRTQDGTANEGLDYLAASETLILRPGETNLITIPILDDRWIEADETLAVLLHNPSSGSNLGQLNSAIVRIVDDDGRPGSLAVTFNPPVRGPRSSYGAESLCVQPDGKLVVASYSSVTRLNGDGSVDTGFAFRSPRQDGILVVALQADGKVLVGGVSSNLFIATLECFFRLNTDGSLDTTLARGALDLGWTQALQVQPNGKILVGGHFAGDDMPPMNNAIARLNADGTVDRSFTAGMFITTFPPGVSGPIVLSVALQADDKILVGGVFTNINGTSQNRIARLNGDGSLDVTFYETGGNKGCDGAVQTIAVQPDGKILIGGRFTSVHGINRNYLARLNVDGAVDTSFSSPLPPQAAVNAIKLQPDGRILIGTGGYDPMVGFAPNSVVRLLASGSLDSTFDPGTGPNGPVNDLVIMPNGDIVIAGGFTAVNGIDRWLIARLKGDGLRLSPPVRLPNGDARITLHTQPGKSYVVQASTNLMDWLPVATDTANSAVTEFTDLTAPSFLQRFYRALQIDP